MASQQLTTQAGIHNYLASVRAVIVDELEAGALESVTETVTVARGTTRFRNITWNLRNSFGLVAERLIPASLTPLPAIRSDSKPDKDSVGVFRTGIIAIAQLGAMAYAPFVQAKKHYADEALQQAPTIFRLAMARALDRIQERLA